MTKKYELMVIYSPVLDSDAMERTQTRVKDLIEQEGSDMHIDDWGMRRLAYEIDDQMDGHYQVITFNAEVDAPKEIERILQITDGVMRYMITVVPE